MENIYTKKNIEIEIKKEVGQKAKINPSIIDNKTIEYLNDLFSLIKFSDIFLNSRFKNDFLILGFFSFSSNLSITVCYKFKILITWLFK